MNFAIATALIVLGALMRLAPHPPNMVAIGALALFSGARLPRFWAYAVPFLAMIGSDLLLDWGKAYSPFQGDYLMRYVAFGVIVAMGTRLKNQTNPWHYVGFSLVGSTLFYLITNFGVWAFPTPAHPTGYPSTLDGLMQSYAAGLAFFKHDGIYQSFFTNTIIADLIGVGALFGLDALATRAARRELAPIAVDGHSA